MMMVVVIRGITETKCDEMEERKQMRYLIENKRRADPMNPAG